MKILFVITSLEIGGAQTFLLRLYEYLQNQGNEVYLLNLHFSKHQLGSGNLKNAFHFHPPGHLNLKIKSYIIRKPISQLRFKAQVNFAKKIINQVKPDIINSHLWFADYVVFETLKKTKKIPHIVSMHGCYENWLNNENKELSDRFIQRSRGILSQCDGIITAAEKNDAIFNEIGIQPTRKCIYYGYPKQVLCLEETDKIIRFGLVARGIKEKGWKEAILAFVELSKLYGNLELILVGGGKYLEVLKKRYEKYDNIVFTGSVHDPRKFIRSITIGLLPTYFPSESLPNTIIEYLAFGKPVISTDIGEIPNMISSKNGDAGFVIRLENNQKVNTQILKNVMQNYIENQSLIAKHSKRAHLAFRKFKLENCSENYLKFFSRFTFNEKNPAS